MEEKLKTLKDIEYNLTDKIDDYTSSGVFSKEIKSEAIKWVKEYERCGKGYRSRVIFIKHFFNLTEETKL